MPKPTAARATVENAAARERPDAVTAIEAAALLGLNERTIRRAIDRGDLPAVRRGRGFAIELQALEAYRLRHAPTAPPVPSTTDLVQVADPEPGLGLLAEPTVLVAEVPLHGGLPTPLTRFVGREREAAALTALLGAGERLVTLTGLGGVGKSRLALAVATDTTPRFADGAAFVALAPVRAADHVLPTILLALGEREGDDRPPLERLTGLLRQRQLLLLLDNLEHVLGVGPALADLLAACPQLTILATSRSPLRVAGERTFPVPPLSLPDAAATDAGAAAVGATEAVRLFVDRARTADAAFALTDANAAAVAAVCRWLDGLPLAIELAAARSAVLPPQALLARLEQRLPLLSGGPRDQPDRLRTMRGAIAWSEDLLDPEQQALLRRLAVFVGGIPLAAAEYVGGDGLPALGGDDGSAVLGGVGPARLRGEGDERGREALSSLLSEASPPKAAGRPPLSAATPPQRSVSPSVLDGLAALLESGLLLRDEVAGGEPRFGMLETVREYALDRLDAAGEETPPSGRGGLEGETAARRAHAAWYLAFAEEAQDALWAATDEALLERIETEHDNLRAALSWALAAEPETALRLAGGLSQFWAKRSYWSEGRSWLERALAVAGGGDSEARAFALGRLGAIAGDQGEFDMARDFLNDSLAMADRLGLDPVRARARRGLGIIASNQSELALATEHFEAALAMFRSLDDQPGIARCLNDLGLVASREGDISRAIAYQEEALPINRSLGDEWQLCVLLGNLGGAYYDHGERDRGEALIEEALAIAERLGDTFGVAVNRYNLGCFALRRGDAAAAAGRFRDVLGLTQVLGERHLVSRVIDWVGAALHLDRKPRLAARLFGAAAALRESLGDALSAEENADFSTRFAAVRSELGEAAYGAAWEMGRSLPYEAAVAEAARLAATLAATSPTTSDLGLTPRETEVLRLMAEGRSDKEIADALFVARSTASKHVAAVIAKLGADSRTAAVSAAHRHRLV